jgi:hypothetical protein
MTLFVVDSTSFVLDATSFVLDSRHGGMTLSGMTLLTAAAFSTPVEATGCQPDFPSS